MMNYSELNAVSSCMENGNGMHNIFENSSIDIFRSSTRTKFSPLHDEDKSKQIRYKIE